MKILSAVSEEENSLVQNFLMRLGTSKVTMKYISCGWVAGESYSSPRTEAKPPCTYLVNQIIVNSLNILFI